MGKKAARMAARSSRWRRWHGWDDEVIPCEHSIRFARLRGCTLHLVPGNHRLDTRIPMLCALFGAFLSRYAISA